MICIGPTPLSGIGQVVGKYARLLHTKYYVLGQDAIPRDQDVFMFALPVDAWLQSIPIIKQVSKRVICMTVCETETVHPVYGKLFDLFDEIAVPSVFAKNVFERQFPNKNFYIIRHYVPPVPIIKHMDIDLGVRPDAYKFYHIGNIADYRKNIRQMIEAFIRNNFDNAQLILKATCNQTIQWKIPNVVIVNGLMPEDQLEQFHKQCDCYVSSSFSEGVGMGAIEAALRDKPVIITEYGGAVEYIKTPYVVKCDRQLLPHDDFLFQKGMEWGKPDFEQLMGFMKQAYDSKIKHMDHSHTKQITGKENVLDQIGVN